MEWLVISVVVAAAGAWVLNRTLNRMQADADRLLAEAPVLRGDAFVDGDYGKITGVARSHAAPVTAPGSTVPCVFYEVVVRRVSNTRNGQIWAEVDRASGGVDLAIPVDGREVLVDPRAAIVIGAPAASFAGHVVVGVRDPALASTTRTVAVDAAVEIAGTLTREVDPDPAAAASYRETAVKWRLIARADRPLVLRVVG